MKLDIGKFSFGELTSNNQGKTSPGIVAGLAIVFTGCFGFTSAGFVVVLDAMFKLVEHNDVLNSLITQSIAVMGIGSTLLGIRRYTSDKKIELNSEETKN